MQSLRVFLALGLPLAVADAQVRPGHAVVACRQTGAPATLLVDVDLASGAQIALGRFPADHLPPRAVAVDDLDREVLVALEVGSAASRLVRLHLAGGGIAGEHVLGDVAGAVTQIAVEAGGALILAVDGPAGGLLRLPRYGGTALPVTAAPFTTAIGDGGYTATWLPLAQSGADGPPARDAAVGIVTLPGGAFTLGPTPLAGYRPRAISGIVDLPTALVRHVLTHDDGTVSMFEYGLGVRPLGVTPQLPPGSTVAMKDGATTFEPLVLGGAAHPYLKSFVAFGGPPVWRLRAGPLPGDPVDFDCAPPAAARVELLGAPCGAPLQAGWVDGWPTLGNQQFALAVSQAAPLQPALLVVGGSDQRFAGGLLPWPLPGGCPLLAAPEVVFVRLASAQGVATQPLPVPTATHLLGLLLFGEWLQLSAGAFTSSAALVLEVGR